MWSALGFGWILWAALAVDLQLAALKVTLTLRSLECPHQAQILGLLRIERAANLHTLRRIYHRLHPSRRRYLSNIFYQRQYSPAEADTILCTFLPLRSEHSFLLPMDRIIRQPALRSALRGRWRLVNSEIIYLVDELFPLPAADQSVLVEPLLGRPELLGDGTTALVAIRHVLGDAGWELSATGASKIPPNADPYLRQLHWLCQSLDNPAKLLRLRNTLAASCESGMVVDIQFKSRLLSLLSTPGYSTDIEHLLGVVRERTRGHPGRFALWHARLILILFRLAALFHATAPYSRETLASKVLEYFEMHEADQMPRPFVREIIRNCQQRGIFLDDSRRLTRIVGRLGAINQWFPLEPSIWGGKLGMHLRRWRAYLYEIGSFMIFPPAIPNPHALIHLWANYVPGNLSRSLPLGPHLSRPVTLFGERVGTMRELLAITNRQLFQAYQLLPTESNRVQDIPLRSNCLVPRALARLFLANFLHLGWPGVDLSAELARKIYQGGDAAFLREGRCGHGSGAEQVHCLMSTTQFFAFIPPPLRERLVNECARAEESAILPFGMAGLEFFPWI